MNDCLLFVPAAVFAALTFVFLLFKPIGSKLSGEQLECRKILAAAFTVFALRALFAVFLRRRGAAVDARAELYLNLIAASLSTALITAASESLLSAGARSFRAAAGSLSTGLFFSVVLGTSLHAPLPPIIETSAYNLFLAYLVFQMVRSFIAVALHVRWAKDRLDRYFAGPEAAYLAFLKTLIRAAVGSSLVAVIASSSASLPVIVVAEAIAALIFALLGLTFAYLVTLNKLAGPLRAAVEAESSLDFDADGDRLLSELASLMGRDRLYADRRVSAVALGARLGVSAGRLSRLIAEALGMNFRSYVTSLRVREAQLLLHDKPEAGLGAIAKECGFGSRSAFESSFVRVVGRTPAQWRTGSR